MLWQRLFFGALLIAALLGLVYADGWLSRGPDAQVEGRVQTGLIVLAILAALVALGAWELARLFATAGHWPLPYWSALISVALLTIPYVVANQRLPSALAEQAGTNELTVACLVIAFVGACFFIACRRRTENAAANIALSMFIVLYLGLLPQFLIRLRMFGPPGSVWLLLYFVGVVKFCDIGAYFTGFTIGRHKLIVWLSPKKTWEGLLGGLATSAGTAVLISYLVRTYAEPSALTAAFPEWPKAAVFGLLMGLVGQGGDLLESLIKRGAQAKDSANAVPAFGGVLDIIDSLLPTAPLAYWMLVQ
jgi:phosphatidate cytidylyltransferase